MDNRSIVDTILQQIKASQYHTSREITRLLAELEFASSFAELHPEHTDEWQQLIVRAAEYVRETLQASSGELGSLVTKIEAMLAPIGHQAKQYTIHCCGHAHIDMNWTWPLVETVATAHDTFTTLDRLMQLYPDLRFGQSQISIYQMMKEYCPEVWDMIRRRIDEGLWQVTAGSWVEGDKNMASGESLCRHILYSKRWLHENLGLPFDKVQIDWLPDTFGHPWSLPSILSRGGIKFYYRCRPESGPWLNWWQGPDGSRVLSFRDKGWYNAEITAEILTKHFIDYEHENGLKDFLWVYGVGDHGGGVTKGHLVAARELDSWPIFPYVKLSGIETYFNAIEPFASELPVQDADYNSVFEGCYTSQSRIKRVNRLAEAIIPEAETISVLANALVGFDYRSEQLQTAWEHALFNQFHDILAGSSGHDAMEEACVRFQQIEAITGSIKTRALRKIASHINTAQATKHSTPANTPDAYASNFGRGAGDLRVPGRVSTWSTGMLDVEPLVVFNTLPYARSEMVLMKVWGRDWPQDRLVVTDDQGNQTPAQVVGTSFDVGHQAINVLFPTCDIPAMGYRTYNLRVGAEAVSCKGVTIPATNQMENEFYHVEIDPSTGAICHLIDKSTDRDLVPANGLLGVLELYREEPHGMTAWDIGTIAEKRVLNEGTPVDETDLRDSRVGDSLGMVYSVRQRELGPQRVNYRTLHKINNSRVITKVALSAGSPMVEIFVTADWREIGNAEIGVPMLKLALPLNLSEPEFTTEIPFGSQKRPTDGKEVPAQRWVDISSSECGATLINDCKYGFSADRNTLRATLLRSTYDPDAFPEMGRHEIRFALIPHAGPCDTATATRLAEAWNQPLCVVGTDIHEGDLPSSISAIEVLSDNISISALKRPEEHDGIILRLYETAGKETSAQVRLSFIAKPGYSCTEVDLLEQPLAISSARMEGDVLIVDLPAHGIATVLVETKHS
ncbi:MAG: alpha-mannosidase [Armatimonadota bacterium]